MEDQNKVEKLVQDVKEYAETRFDMSMLTLQDKVTGVLSSVASFFIIGVLSLFVVFFASIGVAWLIGQYMHNASIGFFIVAGFYFLVTAIILLNRDQWINAPIVNALLRKININEED